VQYELHYSNEGEANISCMNDDDDDDDVGYDGASASLLRNDK